MKTRIINISRFAIGLVSLTVLAGLAWLAIWVSFVPFARGWDSVAVTSGSMIPAISVGDVLITEPLDENQVLEPGAIIVFDNPAGDGQVTHRVVSQDPSGRYVTQGDANARVDSTPVAPEAIRGVGRVLVPAIGTPFVWAERGDILRLLMAAVALVSVALAARWALPKSATGNQSDDHSPSNARIAATPIGAIALTLAVVSTLTNPVGESDAAFAAQTATSNSSFAVEQWKSIVDLDGGLTHACLSRTEGYVWCWGRNDKGQLGDNTTTDSLIPVQVAGPGGVGTLSGITSLASGDSFNCASDVAGGVWCWGENNDGQLGDNTTTDSPAPVQVVGPGGIGILAGVASVSTGDTHACAAATDGTAWCWGRNDQGQLGDNTTTDSLVPVQVVGAGGVGTLTGVSSITGGDKFNCAVKIDGTVWCWGQNTDGQLGSKINDSSFPVQVLGAGGVGTLSGVNEAAAGQAHVCAVRGDGSAWCWGHNDQGQLGDNSTTSSPFPAPVVGAGGIGTLSGAVSVAVGQKHSCVTKVDQTAWCWGQNGDGQLGDNTTTDSPAPVQVLGIGASGFLSGVTLVGAGELFSCAAGSDWTAMCWGRNDHGQLGNNTTTDSSVPVPVKGAGWSGVFADASSIAAGDEHSCAARVDGTVWCWGRNDQGQLGDNTTTDSLVPVPVRGPGGLSLLSGAATVTVGLKHSCAVKSDGTIWCWGHNNTGQLGDNTSADSSSPVQVVGPGGVGALTGVMQAVAGEEFTCGVRSDGSVWCWGRNDKGQLGDNTTTDSVFPVPVTDVGGVGVLTGLVNVGAGLKHACAVKSDGAIWCWGENNEGQLGDNTTVDSPSPVQVVGPGGVGTFTGGKIAGLGALHSCVVRTDATAWCWGRNDKGQLGDNTMVDSLVPVQVVGPGGIGTLALVTQVQSGTAHTCARDSNDRVWCWGHNDKGQLGDNTTSDSSLPVQLTGPGGVGNVTDPLRTAVGAEHGCVIRSDRSVWCWGHNSQGQLGDGTTDDTGSPVQVL